MGYVCIVRGISPPQFLPCLATDNAAQLVVMYQPGLAITKGTIVCPAGSNLPSNPPPYVPPPPPSQAGPNPPPWVQPPNPPWTPPAKFWVCMRDGNLSQSQPPLGYSDDFIHSASPPK